MKADLNNLGYYKPSGRHGLVAVYIVAVLWIAIAVAYGFSYGFLHNFYPEGSYAIHKIMMSIIGVMSALLSFVTVAAVRFAKLRSPKKAVGLALIVGAVVSYASMTSWVYYSSNEPLMLNPADLFSTLESMAQKRSIRGDGFWSSLNGIRLGWILENLLLCSIPAWGAYFVASDPFCENCKRWASKKLITYDRSMPDSPGQLLEQIESGKPILTTGVNEPIGTTWLRVAVKCCPRCDGDAYLTVQKISDEKGASFKLAKESTKTLLSKLIVDRETLRPIVHEGTE